MATIIQKVEEKTIDPVEGPRIARTKWVNDLLKQFNKLAGYEEITVDLCDSVTSATQRVTLFIKRAG